MSENTPGTDVEYVRRLSEDTLRAVATVDDAESALNALGFVIPDEPEFGTGFVKVEDKDLLIKVPFIVMEWRFIASDDFTREDGSPGEFVAAQIITTRGEKCLITDGSTGIYAQLRRITDGRVANSRPNVHPTAGLRVLGGLRKSEFGVNKKTGEIGKLGTPGFDKAVTYYLSE